MTPSSTTHFSLPTSTQLVRSLPLNSWTHCSLGCRVRVEGACAELGAGSAQTIIATQARDDAGKARRRMEFLSQRSAGRIICCLAAAVEIDEAEPEKSEQPKRVRIPFGDATPCQVQLHSN